MAGWGKHLRAPGPAVCRGLGRELGPPRAPSPPGCPRPVPGLSRRGCKPSPSRARSTGRASRGQAWRPRGARRRRGPSPWRPEEAAVCAASRTKRGAPLPAIVLPRPPGPEPGPWGGGGAENTRPTRPLVPAPPLPVPGLQADPQAPPWSQGFPAQSVSPDLLLLGEIPGGRRGGTRTGTHPPRVLGPRSLSSPKTPLSVVTFNFPRPAIHPALRGPPEGH